MKKKTTAKLLLICFACLFLNSCAMLNDIGRGLASALNDLASSMRKANRYSRTPYIPSSGSSRGRNTKICFVAGTKVLMSNGSLKAIEKIKVGDMVMAFPENNARYGKLKAKRVLNIMSSKNIPVVRAGGLLTTKGHPFVGPQGQFARVANLKFAVARDGKIHPIKCSQVVRKTTVYNIEVHDYHTYLVKGERFWRVHNASKTGCKR